MRFEVSHALLGDGEIAIQVKVLEVASDDGLTTRLVLQAEAAERIALALNAPWTGEPQEVPGPEPPVLEQPQVPEQVPEQEVPDGP